MSRKGVENKKEAENKEEKGGMRIKEAENAENEEGE